jgi:hypothetical protein
VSRRALPVVIDPALPAVWHLRVDFRKLFRPKFMA